MKITRVTWAIEALSDDPAFQAAAGFAIRALTARKPPRVEPVCVLPPERILVPGVGAISRPDPEPVARESMARLLKRVLLPRLSRPAFVASPGPAVRDYVATLLGQAKKRRADLIVVSTHARRGLSRWFMGSFAETLIVKSRVPVLVVSPALAPPKRISHVLFPTDFSKESRRAFESVIELARLLGVDILLFHQDTLAIAPVALPFIPIPPSFEASMLETGKSLKALGAAWARLGEKRGVRVRFHYSVARKTPADAILAAARRLPAGVVAMAAQSGPVASAVLGSVTRQVVRESRQPVIVIPSSR